MKYINSDHYEAIRIQKFGRKRINTCSIVSNEYSNIWYIRFIPNNVYIFSELLD